jgi:NTE family protein
MPDCSAAFSGAGFLAPAHGGAYCALAELGYAPKDLAGTSAGSIIAALIASGHTPAQIKQIALGTDFRPLFRLSWGALLSLSGYCNGNALLRWLESQLGDMTFATATLPVTIVATDLRTQRPLIFSRDTTPDVRLSFACRCSASVPLGYLPVRYGNALLVDGGVSNNIPVDKLRGPVKIGIDIVDTQSDDLSTPLDRLGAVVSTMLATNENARIALGVATGAKIVRVPALGYGFMNTRLTGAQKTALFESGHNAVLQALGGGS